LYRILNFFGECSGLKINISKTEIYPIRLHNTAVPQLQNRSATFAGQNWSKATRLERQNVIYFRKGNFGQNRPIITTDLPYDRVP
jgi:hypothetical protein